MIDLLPPEMLESALAAPEATAMPISPTIVADDFFADPNVAPEESLVPGVAPDFAGLNAWVDEPDDLYPPADPADIIGTLDREDAKRDLAPYFAVSPHDFDGPHKHNEVTQEEFEKIARTYSDIRRGQGDLSINTDRMKDPKAAAAYREQVMTDIAKLMRTTSGRNQIEFLNNAPDDAKTSIRPRMDATGKQVGEANYELHGADGDEHRIYFSDVYNRKDDDGMPIDTPKGTSHLVLAHEMEHAHQRIMGTKADGMYGVPGDDYRSPNSERKTVGLVHSDPAHPADPTAATENRIRWEENENGEKWLPRTNYDGSWNPVPGSEPNDEKRDRAWTEFLSSKDHPGFE